ncbi:hypothetical protein AB3332_13470 [Ralstonia solanacearum]|uniref:hypothetical protein n=1 Tax=Ralstonia solanacearum TaxID=305 RepID=UPI0034DCD602
MADMMSGNMCAADTHPGELPRGNGSGARGRTMMTSENPIDLNIALRKLHELALEDGDLGYEYWHRVAQLLRQAARMESEIEALSQELEKCRARRGT